MSKELHPAATTTARAASVETALESAGMPASLRAHLLADDQAIEVLAAASGGGGGWGGGGSASAVELLNLQQSDGSFGSVGSTAAAVLALQRFITEESVLNGPVSEQLGSEQLGSEQRESGLRPEVVAAVERALAWIRSIQASGLDAAPTPRSPGTPGLVGCELDTAALLWLLGPSPLLWRCVEDVASLADAAHALGLARFEPIDAALRELDRNLGPLVAATAASHHPLEDRDRALPFLSALAA